LGRSKKGRARNSHRRVTTQWYGMLHSLRRDGTGKQSTLGLSRREALRKGSSPPPDAGPHPPDQSSAPQEVSHFRDHPPSQKRNQENSRTRPSIRPTGRIVKSKTHLSAPSHSSGRPPCKHPKSSPKQRGELSHRLLYGLEPPQVPSLRKHHTGKNQVPYSYLRRGDVQQQDQGGNSKKLTA